MAYQITPDTLPDYHFLFIVPNVEADWLFDAARTYYNRFKPTIVQDAGLIAIVPLEYSVSVSLLTRRDAFRTFAVEVAKAREDAFLDALVYENAAEAASALNARAEANQPFGVPLVPTPTPSLRDPILPTPGAITGGGAITEGGSGFVTQQPTASTGFITVTPSPAPTLPNLDAQGEPREEISPTPGAIVGGSE